MFEPTFLSIFSNVQPHSFICLGIVDLMLAYNLFGTLRSSPLLHSVPLLYNALGNTAISVFWSHYSYQIKIFYYTCCNSPKRVTIWWVHLHDTKTVLSLRGSLGALPPNGCLLSPFRFYSKYFLKHHVTAGPLKMMQKPKRNNNVLF